MLPHLGSIYKRLDACRYLSPMVHLEVAVIDRPIPPPRSRLNAFHLNGQFLFTIGFDEDSQECRIQKGLASQIRLLFVVDMPELI